MRTVMDRSFPAPLRTRMSTSDWTYFCDKVDTALDPMNGLKGNNSCSMCRHCMIGSICFGVAALGFLFGTVEVLQPAFSFVIIIVVAIFMSYFFRRYLRNTKQNVSNVISDVNRNLNNLCNEENAKSDNVTFYVKFNVNSFCIPSAACRIEYIERSFEDAEGFATLIAEATPVFTSVAIEDGTPSAPPILYKHSK